MTVEALIVALQDKLYLTFILGLIYFAVRIFINHFTTTSLERRLMTPMEKFNNNLSISLVVTFIVSAFLGIMVFLDMEEYKDIIEKNNLSDGWVITIIIFFAVIICIITLVFYFLLKVLEWSISLNYKYYLVDKNNLFEIIRTNSKGILLVKDKDELFFISNPLEQRYKKIINSGNKKKEFYKNLKFTNPVIITLVKLLIVLTVCIFFINGDIWKFFLFVICVLIALSLLIIWVQYMEYKKK